jgi:xanthine dehydrogenase accessory factor
MPPDRRFGAEGGVDLGEIEQVLEKASDWLRAGRRVLIATVIESKGSSPRRAGAKMAVSSTGETVGTVGGGAVEKKVLEAAPEVLKSGKPAILDFDLSGRSPAIDSVCGGEVKVFLEPLGEYRRLFILGAGHIGRALARTADAMGFAVTLVDDRDEALKREDLPASIRLVKAGPGDGGKVLDMDASSFAVIATRSHALDGEWLGALCGVGLRYVGMVGSKRKIETIYGALREQGVPRTFLDGVHAPIGLDIAAETPEEIAVSIAAEIIKVWREGERDGT